jgi:hypothetical protein
VTAASANRDAANRRSATATRFAGPLIYAQPREKTSRVSLDINVIPEACPLKLNGSAEHLANGPEQATGLRAADPAGRSLGVNARVKKRLVRVDVTQPCDDGLVEQQTFDRSSAAAQRVTELRLADLERIRPEGVEDLRQFRRGAATEPAEPAAIPIPKLIDASVQK